MQCHAIVLDTTGTARARQQPKYVEREKKRKKNNEKKAGKRTKQKNENKDPSKGRPTRGSKNTPSLRQDGYATRQCPPGGDTARNTKNKKIIK